MPKDKRHENLTRGDDRALKALGRTRLPKGYATTKPMRFTLPEGVASALEGMTKKERDILVERAMMDAMPKAKRDTVISDVRKAQT